MNLIIPMAGKGTRLRPQTLSTPKPLIPIAGKTILQRLVDLVSLNSNIKIKRIGFIIEKPDLVSEKILKSIAQKNGVPCDIFYQGTPRGTAHAIHCAAPLLEDEVLVVFADTLFETKLDFSNTPDVYIFVKEVEDPRQYGVVSLNEAGEIVEFVEKPPQPTSNLAIVGMYYFKKAQLLLNELKKVLDKKLLDKGEYQLTTALENLRSQNIKILPFEIDQWLDFGTPDNLLQSHSIILHQQSPQNINKFKDYKNTIIHPPCYFAPDVVIKNSEIGPNVSIGPGSVILDSRIKNTIIQSNTTIKKASLINSIIGSFVEYSPNKQTLNIGDYSKFN